MEEIAGKTRGNYCWYAVYTVARTEQYIKEQWDKAGIETYVPVQSVVRLWNGCKKRIMTPIIPRCIFVRLLDRDIPTVVTIRGVSFLLKDASSLLTNEKQLVSISEEQMVVLRCLIDHSEGPLEFVPTDVLSDEVGKTVRAEYTQRQVGRSAECILWQKEDGKLLFSINGLGVILATVDDTYMKDLNL